jgi:hypothetical protein
MELNLTTKRNRIKTAEYLNDECLVLKLTLVKRRIKFTTMFKALEEEMREWLTDFKLAMANIVEEGGFEKAESFRSNAYMELLDFVMFYHVFSLPLFPSLNKRAEYIKKNCFLFHINSLGKLEKNFVSWMQIMKGVLEKKKGTDYNIFKDYVTKIRNTYPHGLSEGKTENDLRNLAIQAINRIIEMWNESKNLQLK